MQPEPPPDNDDSRELLDKVDALLKRHQPKRHTAPAAAEPEPQEAPELPELLESLEWLEPLEPTEPPEQPEQQPEPPQSEPPPMAITEPPEPDTSAFDDIPVLTDIVDEPTDLHSPAGLPLPDNLLLDLQDRLYREFEAHIVPQLSMAFGKALNELLSQAKIHIGVAVREHLVQELRSKPQTAPRGGKIGD